MCFICSKEVARAIERRIEEVARAAVRRIKKVARATERRIKSDSFRFKAGGKRGAIETAYVPAEIKVYILRLR